MSRDLNSWLLPQNSTGYIVGVRGWLIIDESLSSLCKFCLWPVGHPLECETPLLKGEGASYDTRKHSSKRVGIFAFKNSFQLSRCCLGFCYCGEVALWGEIAEHEWGYRAQYAYPLTLIQSRGGNPSCRGRGLDLAKRYGCKYLGEYS